MADLCVRLKSPGIHPTNKFNRSLSLRERTQYKELSEEDRQIGQLKKQDKGVYFLILVLTTKQWIRAGKLQQKEFEPGLYLYIGSAQNGLLGRIVRHLRKEKKMFWHIDYFLQKAKIKEIWVRNDYFDECLTLSEAKNSLKHSCFPLKKFGSSDCRCPSHLIFLHENKADLESLREKLSFEKIDIHEIQT